MYLLKVMKFYGNENDSQYNASGFLPMHEATCRGQGPRSLRKCAGAKGGTTFLGDFLLHFCAIWKNDPFSKSENVPGLKPRLPRRLRGP